jgi:hypothetical protein
VGIIFQEIKNATNLFGNSFTPASIITATLDCNSTTTSASDPFIFTINIPTGTYKAGTMLCKYWNETLEKWDSNGMSLRGETVDADGYLTRVTCGSTHLTSFTALVVSE